VDDSSARSVLVTGASRGIGLEIATQLAAAGMALTITSRNRDDLDALAPMLRSRGAPEVICVAADMADGDTLRHLIRRHTDVHTDMSALVVNAGVGTAGTVARYPRDRLDKTMAVNFLAPFELIQLALPLLRAGAARHRDLGAKIVVLSSITGVYAEAGLAAYGASKAAVMSLVDALNAEESGAGVLASAIAPGYVNTDMSAWVQGEVPPDAMITTRDVGVLVMALLSLSRRAVVGRLVVSRAGTGGYQA
jgi:3-oxoacyl-[acyl-carrier protein] reductase